MEQTETSKQDGMLTDTGYICDFFNLYSECFRLATPLCDEQSRGGLWRSKNKSTVLPARRVSGDPRSVPRVSVGSSLVQFRPDLRLTDACSVFWLPIWTVNPKCLIMDRPDDPDQAGDKDWTPLHQAALKGMGFFFGIWPPTSVFFVSQGKIWQSLIT